MKSFTISLILLALALLCVLFNALYINNVTLGMESRIASLPDPSDPSCLSAVAGLRDYWEKSAPPIRFSVIYPAVDRVGEQIASLSASASCGDLYGYRSALALLRDAVSDLRRRI